MNEFNRHMDTAPERTRTGEPIQRTAETLASAGRAVRDTASDVASGSAENLKGQASQLVDTAKGIASEAGNLLQEKVSEQKGAGAEYVNRLAQSLDRASAAIETDYPIAGSYVRTAASQVHNAAEALKTGNIDDLVRRAQAFARIAVGTLISERPPHRTVRAGFPHTAPTLGV
jgi:type VI protein secretion system component VasK